MNSGAPEAVIANDLEFLNKLQRILNEGIFTASYKYALILSLAELSVEKSPAPDQPLHLPIREVAERFMSLYWRQAAPFGRRAMLWQNAGQQASAIRMLAAFRETAPTLSAARRHQNWPTVVGRIRRLLLDQPIWKLQLVGKDRLDFLYEERLVDDAIVLRPRIAACFQRQFAIVQALVQMAWLTFVQKLPPNRPILGTTGDLAEFMFGAERSGLREIVNGLMDLQAGACFYCGAVMRDSSAVDHFIPWSRYPRDLGHNFVLVHTLCNQHKRDMLAAPAHLEHWVSRTLNDGQRLREIFEVARFIFDADASMSVAEWSYRMPNGQGLSCG